MEMKYKGQKQLILPLSGFLLRPGSRVIYPAMKAHVSSNNILDEDQLFVTPVLSFDKLLLC